MADDINIAVRVDGIEASVRELERLIRTISDEKRVTEETTEAVEEGTDAEKEATEARKQAAESMRALVNGGQTLISRVQGVAGAVQSLVSSFGSENHAAGLIASIAGATAQFASMGAVIGPGGAVIGGLIGLTTGLYNAANAADDTADAADRARRAIHDLAAERVTARREEGIARGLGSGGTGLSEAELDQRREEARLRLGEAEAEVRRLIDAGIEATATGYRFNEEEVARRREALEAARELVREQNNIIDGVRREVDARADAVHEAERMEELRRAEEELLAEDTAGPDERTRALDARNRRERAIRDAARSGGASRADELAATFRSWEDAEDAFYAESTERLQAKLDEEAAMLRAEEDEKTAILEDGIERRRAAEIEAMEAIAAHEAEVLAERQERAAALQAAGHERDQRAIEQREQAWGEMFSIGQQVTDQLTTALGDVISGSKTTEEAFLGLAKSFLEMISQYASLKAGTEFAEAGGAFARYDYGGGAAHVAAGLAFTAVAVATGVGAAAINTAPQAPPRPEAAVQAGGNQGNVTNVINWNSPVVTAGTRAELGREVGYMLAEAGGA